MQYESDAPLDAAASAAAARFVRAGRAFLIAHDSYETTRTDYPHCVHLPDLLAARDSAYTDAAVAFRDLDEIVYAVVRGGRAVFISDNVASAHNFLAPFTTDGRMNADTDIVNVSNCWILGSKQILREISRPLHMDPDKAYDPAAMIDCWRKIWAPAAARKKSDIQ